MTRRYVVELQQNTAFSNQSFSIKPDQRSLSDNPSDIDGKNGFKRPDLPSDNKRQRFLNYEVKTTLIESISWQLLYATNLLLAFELIMTSKAPPLGATYSWLPAEGIVTVGWLLKSYWNPDSLLFKPIEQSEMRLSQGNQPFAITTMMHGSGYDQQQPQQQSQLSESSGQRAPQATSQQTGAFTSPLFSGTGDGYGDPQQDTHTLGLDCFVYPCYGVCEFRPSFENTEPDESWLNFEESLASYTEVTPGQNPCPHDCLCFRCIWHFDPENERSNDPFAIELKCTSGQLFQLDGIDDNPVNTTAPAEQVTCDLTIVGKDGQLRNCEKVYRSIKTLLNHKGKVHSGKKTCLVPVVGKDGRLRPCGEVSKNAGALSNHKRRAHSGQQTCEVIMVTEDGQERPCGKVCMNASALSNHKKCAHTGQRTCDMTVVGEDGQPQTCGKLCKSAQSLSCHKFSHHTGQKTCDVILIGKDGQQRPCGKVYKNVSALRYHKKNTHTGQKTCDVIVADEDGQQQPCGKVYKNAKTLAIHKRTHRKRKPVDTNQKDGHSPP
ncbi:hypothetical protein [Endozoicomonas sp. ALC020]|uniref:hypothetical protein n=1 Tax=unclassified Endozoicomonas TaxID=2644528 RepID=UPI003BAF4B02